MALTARELVFFIRAENQASGAIRKVAKDIGGLRNLKGVQDAAAKAQIRNNNAISKSQLAIVRNEEAIKNAMAQRNRLGRMAARGRAVGGFSAADIRLRYEAAASAVVRLQEQEKILTSNLDEARIAAGAQADEFERLGKAIPLERLGRMFSLSQRIGKVLAVSGLVVGAGLGVAASRAAEFQTQATLAATQARPVGASNATTAAKTVQVSNAVLKLMNQFPASAQEMSDSFYQIFSGTNVQNVAKATKLVRVFNQMAVAGGTDLKTMTDAGISLYNNFPNEFKNMTQAANAFFSAVRYGRMNAEQFAGSLSRVLPIAKASGLTFKDVADAMALITRQTGGARTGLDATGLARLIEMIGRKDVVAGLHKYGIEVQDATGKMRPLLDIITDIHDKFISTGKLKPGPDTLNFFKMISAKGSGGAGTAGTVQGRRAFDYLVTSLKEYQKVSHQVNTDSDEFIKSFKAMQKTPGVQWKIFINQLKALVYEIGIHAIPIIIQLSKPIVAIAHYFESLSGHTQHLIAYFAAIGSVAAVLGGSLLMVAGALGHIYVALKLLQLAGGLKLALLGEAGAAAPWVAVLLAALVGLSILLIKYPGIIHSISNAIGGLKGAMMALAIVAAGLTMRTAILGMIALSGAEATAFKGALRLRGGLLGLLALGAIIIPVVLKVSNDLQKTHGHDARVSTYSNNPIIGALQKGNDALTYGLDRALGDSAKGARDAVRGTNSMGLTLFPHGSTMKSLSDFNKRRIGNLLGDMQVGQGDLIAAQVAMQNGDMKTFNKIYRKYLPPAAKRAGNMSDADPRQASITAQRAAVVTKQVKAVMKKSFMDRLKAVAELQAVYAKSPTFANHTKYFQALAKLNKDYSSKMYQDYISDYLSRVDSANKDQLKKTTKDATAYAQQLTNAYSNIAQTYNTFLQQNQSNFGSLFGGPFMSSARMQDQMQWNGGKVKPGDVLKDLHSQLFQFNRFNGAVGQLQKKGAPQSLIDSLNAAGPSAMKDIQALNRLTPAQTKEYIATWNRAQKAIKANTMKQLNNQLATYRKFGKNVAQAIITGIQSEDPKLEKVLQGIVQRMFPDLVKKAGKAPKTVPRGSKQNLAPHKVEHHYHYNPTIVNPVTESVGTALRKTFFHMKMHKW